MVIDFENMAKEQVNRVVQMLLQKILENQQAEGEDQEQQEAYEQQIAEEQ